MNSDTESITPLLKSLGLSDKEALTYQALLELESVSIRKVAEHTGINRGTTYEAIKKLITYGLVSLKRRGKREYYTAESPEQIYSIIREQRKDLWQTLQNAQQIVPSLVAQKVRNQGHPVVRYYEGDEGIVTILKDVLRTCGQMKTPEYYAYSSRPLRQYLYRRFPHYTDRRVDEGIRVKVIAIGEGGEPAAESERKWLPEPENGEISSYTIIYDNKVASFSISADLTPYGVVIEDDGLSAMQRLLFFQLWNRL
jgi:sugar-specific transcriptional regulator TrmB